MSSKIIPFYDPSNDDDRPLPERLIDEIGGAIISIDLHNGRRVYCVRDWVYWVSGSEAHEKHRPWSDLKKSLKKQGNFKFAEIISELEITLLAAPVRENGGSDETENCILRCAYLSRL